MCTIDSATSDHSTPIPISHDACASRTHISSDRPLIRLRFLQAQKLYCQVRKCDLLAVAKLHEPGDSPATARPMADAARTTGGGMVHVARFAAQLREGLKLACDADSSAYRIYWYGYEPEGREFESPRARHLNSLPFIGLANSLVESPSRFWVHLGPLRSPPPFQASRSRLSETQELPARRFPPWC